MLYTQKLLWYNHMVKFKTHYHDNGFDNNTRMLILCMVPEFSGLHEI